VNLVLGSFGWKEAVCVAVLVVAAGWLFLANLGDQFLWDDEAQTALIAKTVMTDGVPRGYDGKNFFSQERGREYGRNYIYRWHPWFPFYLLAGVFSVCGIGQWTARLPFALMGWATVPLCYWFARSLWESRRAAVLAAVLVATSVPFLVFSRQCRYFSPCALFSLLGLIAYCYLVRRRRWAGVALVVSAVLLFHSLFLYWAVLVAAVLIHAAIFHRDRLAAVASWSAVTLLLNVPWLVWLLSPPTVGRYPEQANPWNWPFVNANQYLVQSYLHVFSPLLVVLLLVLGIISKARTKRFVSMDADSVRGASLLLLFILINYVALCLSTPLCFFRYLAPAIPPLCLLAAKVLDSSMRLHWSVGIAALAAILGLSRLPDYLYEITHHYVGPVNGIVAYLNQHGKPDDVVAITYGDLPLKFYTTMRVVGGLTGEDLTPALAADWVIVRRDIHCDKDEAVAAYLKQNLPWQRYRRIELDCPDIPYNNREDPDEHCYRTVTDAPPVVIFQKIKGN
jgi:4-amino-4-deoxy-L-arabinose transferase-like glycosyltransferase